MKSVKKKNTRDPKKLDLKRKKLQHKLDHILKTLKKVEKGAAEPSKIESSRKTANPYNYAEFVKTREKLFKSLSDSISLNIAKCCNHSNVYDVEAISLKLEQKAILACMATAVYKNVAENIIETVKKLTEENKMIPELLKFQPTKKQNSEPENTKKPMISNNINTKSNREHAPSPTTVPLIAKISPTVIVSQDNVAVDKKLWSPCSDQCAEMPVSNPEHDLEPGLADYLCHIKESPNSPQINIAEENEEPIICDSNAENDMELDHLMSILEGDLSAEKKDLQLNKIRDLFGNDDSGEKPLETENTDSEAEKHKQKRLIKLYRNERNIFLYKVLTSFRSMSANRFFHTRRQFSAYFGEDSDYEQEYEMCDKEKYLNCCSRRIFSTVARFIMPYYKQGRISHGPFVFKNLVRRIADSLVEENNYPTDYDVRCYVDKFFPSGKKYVNVSEVWCFIVDG